MQFREFHQNIGHFITTFATANVDNDVGIGPFCQLMLYNGFTGTKWPWNSGDTALSDREQRVNDALARDQRPADGLS